MPIRKSDIYRSDIISPSELSSDGYFIYLPSISVISTTNSSKTVVISPIPDGEGLTLPSFDHPVKSGDITYINGSSGADGYYTIDIILSDTSFTVIDTIVDSIGGTVDFMYPVGAGLVGFDSTGLTMTDATNVQGAIKDFDQNAISYANHETLRHLIHFVDDGPGDLFASDAYREITPFGNPFPTNITWYTDTSKAYKIIEKIIVWNIPFPSSLA